MGEEGGGGGRRWGRRPWIPRTSAGCSHSQPFWKLPLVEDVWREESPEHLRRITGHECSPAGEPGGESAARSSFPGTNASVSRGAAAVPPRTRLEGGGAMLTDTSREQAAKLLMKSEGVKGKRRLLIRRGCRRGYPWGCTI